MTLIWKKGGVELPKHILSHDQMAVFRTGFKGRLLTDTLQALWTSGIWTFRLLFTSNEVTHRLMWDIDGFRVELEETLGQFFRGFLSMWLFVIRIIFPRSSRDVSRRCHFRTQCCPRLQIHQYHHSIALSDPLRVPPRICPAKCKNQHSSVFLRQTLQALFIETVHAIWKSPNQLLRLVWAVFDISRLSNAFSICIMVNCKTRYKGSS